MTMDPVLFILLFLSSLCAALVTMGMSVANRKAMGKGEKLFLLFPVLGFLGFMFTLVTEVSLAIAIPAFLVYLFIVNLLSKA